MVECNSMNLLEFLHDLFWQGNICTPLKLPEICMNQIKQWVYSTYTLSSAAKYLLQISAKQPLYVMKLTVHISIRQPKQMPLCLPILSASNKVPKDLCSQNLYLCFNPNIILKMWLLANFPFQFLANTPHLYHWINLGWPLKIYC